MESLSQSIRKLTISISRNDQNRIIERSLKYGRLAEVEANLVEPFWIGYGARDFNIEQNNPEIPQKFHGRYSYLMRGDSKKNWQWSDHELEKIINRIIMPISNCIKSLHRIAVILQIPGKEVPAHRDLIVGDKYTNLISPYSTLWGTESHVYKGDSWLGAYHAIDYNSYHADQGYFGLRIPLSEKDNSSGKMFIESKNGERYFYNTGSHLFLLNEATHNHGAEPTDHYRGVVIIDGALSLDKFYPYFSDIPTT